MLARPPSSFNGASFPPTMQLQPQPSSQNFQNQYPPPLLPPNFQGNQPPQPPVSIQPPILPPNMLSNQPHVPLPQSSIHSPNTPGNQEQTYFQSPIMTNGTSKILANLYLKYIDTHLF